jgi:G:T-mismatch repair DNA endonuclease (very short patch repair protein)
MSDVYDKAKRFAVMRNIKGRLCFRPVAVNILKNRIT